MRTLCYHSHRGLPLECLVQLRKILWLLILFIWVLAADWSLQAYCLCFASSPPSPPLKGENGLAPVHVERECKVQLWISVVSFRRESFADEKVALIGHMLFICVVYTQVIRLPKCLLGDMNPKRPDCSSPTSLPEKKQWPLSDMGNKTVLHENQQQCWLSTMQVQIMTLK